MAAEVNFVSQSLLQIRTQAIIFLLFYFITATPNMLTRPTQNDREHWIGWSGHRLHRVIWERQAASRHQHRTHANPFYTHLEMGSEASRPSAPRLPGPTLEKIRLYPFLAAVAPNSSKSKTDSLAP